MLTGNRTLDLRPPRERPQPTRNGDAMSKPAILTVDDDPMVSAAIGRDLLARYGADFRVVRATSGAEALDLLARLALRDDPVAMVVADQRMPRMTGTEMLAQARAHAPDAKLLLLTAYADTDVAITAINDIGLDYYLMKPWDPPDERLYPVVDDLLDDWRRDHPEQAYGRTGVPGSWIAHFARSISFEESPTPPISTNF